MEAGFSQNVQPQFITAIISYLKHSKVMMWDQNIFQDSLSILKPTDKPLIGNYLKSVSIHCVTSYQILYSAIIQQGKYWQMFTVKEWWGNICQILF